MSDLTDRSLNNTRVYMCVLCLFVGLPQKRAIVFIIIGVYCSGEFVNVRAYMYVARQWRDSNHATHT